MGPSAAASKTHRIIQDFDDAIAVHAAWKHKFSEYLANWDGALNLVDIGDNEKCQLGRWIQSRASTDDKYPEYERLKKAHARFHRAAAEIAQRASHGQTVGAELVFGSASQFTKTSSEVIQAIVALRNRSRSKQRHGK